MEFETFLLFLAFPLGFSLNVTSTTDTSGIMEKLKDLQSKSDALEKRLSVVEGEKTTLRQEHDALKQTVANGNTLIANLTYSIQQVKLEFDNYKNSHGATDVSMQTIGTLQHSISALKDDLVYINTVMERIGNRTSQLEDNKLDKTVFQRLQHHSGFAATTSNDITSSTNKVIVFDSVISSFGTGYDSNTGIFTADADGYYVFFVSARGDERFSWCYLRIVKNGSALAGAYFDGGSGETHFSDSTQVVVHLNVGDKVWIREESTSSCVIDNASTFMGVLLFMS